MNIIRYTDTRAFCDKVLPLLLLHEAENNLMIGILLRLVDNSQQWGDQPPLLCLVEENGVLIAAATQTPPYNVILTRMDQIAATALAQQLIDWEYEIPGVLGPSESVDHFNMTWCSETGNKIELEHGLGVYQLDQVIPPAAPTGYCAVATEQDTELLLRWHREFCEDTGLPVREAEKVVRQTIAERRYQLWHDPHPVSLAVVCGPTPNGIRISEVYTPAAYRGKGYASANVAALSQRMLDTGRQFCYLFTDLANPTSNSIYRKIGYRQVSEFTAYRLVKPGEP
ncbi:MAG: GNAT family N-acetyltransferase [bacterium]